MTTIQDVITAERPAGAWSLTEASGTDFAPYIGGSHLSGSGTFLYHQTGPSSTGFALGINVGAKVSLGFIATVVAPDTFECWYKLPLPLSADQYLFYNGHAGTNGNGFYVKHTDSHIHYLPAGGTDTDTGAVWPDSNWHMIDAGADGSRVFLYFDGVAVFSTTVGGSPAPSPNTLFIGADSALTSANAILIAWPSFFTYALTANQAFADHLAATDPADALALTVGSGSNSNDLLNQILAAVSKTFPTT